MAGRAQEPGDRGHRLAALGAFVLIRLSEARNHIVCQVWPRNGPDGESFEFKVSDFKEYKTLEEGRNLMR